MSSNDFKLNLYRFLIFVLAFGTFVFQTNAQRTENSNLSGSYQIDSAKSENVNAIIANASRQNTLSSADIVDLETKLTAPVTLSIEVSGTQVTLASSTSEPITLNADGSLATANSSSGIQVRIRTSLLNNTLQISSLYDNTDYSITFKSINNGKNLQVTRTVNTNYLQRTVVAQSFYNRTNSPPVFAGNLNIDNRFSNSNFIVPGGMVLTVVLENIISTKDSQNNDPFRLTVTSPGEYQGAMIEGYLSGIERANGISGRAKMTLNFQKIKLTNGQNYEFSGVIQSISASNNTAIKNTDESQLKGQNKSNESIKRGIIGGGVGAVIGAAIGGKKGAVIGAAIGGGGGLGTVLLEDNNLELKRGTQINIESTSPN